MSGGHGAPPCPMIVLVNETGGAHSAKQLVQSLPGACSGRASGEQPGPHLVLEGLWAPVTPGHGLLNEGSPELTLSTDV